MDAVIELNDMAEQRAHEPKQKNTFDKIKRWVKYALFALIILVTLYSFVIGIINPNDANKKEHDQKVDSILQSLYKLIAAANNLPNIASVQTNLDPLDDLNSNILDLLKFTGNYTLFA